MPNEDLRDPSDPRKPLPHCNALLVCEKVSVSQITGAVSLHNLIERFRSRVFPAVSTRFTIFLQLYDGIGQYPFAVQFNALSDDSNVAEIAFDVLDFPARLTKMDLTIPIDFLTLPKPERYEVVILLGGQRLATQHFDAEEDNGKQ